MKEPILGTWLKLVRFPNSLGCSQEGRGTYTKAGLSRDVEDWDAEMSIKVGWLIDWLILQSNFLALINTSHLGHNKNWRVGSWDLSLPDCLQWSASFSRGKTHNRAKLANLRIEKMPHLKSKGVGEHVKTAVTSETTLYFLICKKYSELHPTSNISFVTD